MRILVLGADGYIGWPLCLRLQNLGHEVIGIDNYVRRLRVNSINSSSVMPIGSPEDRNRIFKIDRGEIKHLVRLPEVDTVVHLAEQPSAAWSMIDKVHSCETVNQNLMGTMNLLWMLKGTGTHLVKLGTMGEYGTPDCDIPEGFIEDGPMKGLPFPKSPGSFYHLSKVFDSQSVEFACKMWDLRATDVMQGIVFGTRTAEIVHPDLNTRFDYDEYFGTVINRFCSQAVAGVPLTVYGGGGQKRGFLPLRDSIECLVLAIENPPADGEYRVFNQFAREYSVNEIAWRIKKAGEMMGLDISQNSIPNPRIESESHQYNPKCEKLKALGYNPTWAVHDEIQDIIEDLMPNKHRINKNNIMPKTTWK